MAVEALILVSNPGSASRKYALFEDGRCRAQLHFEYLNGKVICTLTNGSLHQQNQTGLTDVALASSQVEQILKENGVLKDGERISHVGLRIVAPGSYFLSDHIVDDELVMQLKDIEYLAPLHIGASLHELELLREYFSNTTVVGISDSAFHVTKPDFAWNYGLPLEDADQFDVKRFGYHGLAVAAVVHTLQKASKLPPKVVVCHLGSGASVTAVHNGRSIDTTMGYSPLEGLIMATRVGSIDVTAAQAMKTLLKFNDDDLDIYLNTRCGLRGLSGSTSDIRELLELQAQGDHRAYLALQTYTHTVQKAIGQMIAVLGGVDLLAFSGTVGERSFPMRERIMRAFHYVDLNLDEKANYACDNPFDLTLISELGRSKPVFVVPTNEAQQIARQVKAAAKL